MDDIIFPQENDDDRLFIRSVGDKNDLDFRKHPIDDNEVDLGLPSARPASKGDANKNVLPVISTRNRGSGTRKPVRHKISAEK